LPVVGWKKIPPNRVREKLFLNLFVCHVVGYNWVSGKLSP
jgi:hypothetical protein